MRKLGWDSKNRRTNGKQTRVWVAPDSKEEV